MGMGEGGGAERSAWPALPQWLAIMEDLNRYPYSFGGAARARRPVEEPSGPFLWSLRNVHMSNSDIGVIWVTVATPAQMLWKPLPKQVDHLLTLRCPENKRQEMQTTHFCRGSFSGSSDLWTC